jgi:protein-S-isoprenylcysteine O-methyltransferase Ste14
MTGIFANISMPHQRGKFAALPDLAGRSALIVLMFFMAQGCVLRMTPLLAQMSRDPSLIVVLDLFNEVGTLFFAALVGLLSIIRLPARRTAPGWKPVASALAGSFILTLINQMPVIALPFGLTLISGALLAIGNIATVYCLIHLGRSFSVLPQARALVQSGPYRYIRHPLYVAEALATFGMVLIHFGWVAVLVSLAQFLFQWRRIGYEEAVLRSTFAEYIGYAHVTPRFIPRLTLD